MALPIEATLEQTALRTLLIEQETAGALVTVHQMAEATGLKASTIRTYLSKFLHTFLVREERGQYRVSGIASMDEQHFLRLLSQSTRRREKPGKIRDPLARALAEKARENMILALELYNRPSLANRLDSFTQIFCTAWEQLMKAEIQEVAPGRIFRPENPKRQRKETIGFQDCLKQLFQELSPVRQNLEEIQELRDESTHLLMRELQPIASHLFQAGVLNFAARYATVCGDPLMSGESPGLMSLVLSPPPMDPQRLREAYGNATARDILAKAQEMEVRIMQSPSNEYAIPFTHEVVLAKKPGPGDIRLALIDPADGPDASAVILKKPTDVGKICRHRMKDLAHLLHEHFHRAFTNHEMLAMIETEKVKGANSDFHHYYEISKTHGYSDACLDRLKSRITRDPGYVKRCVDSYNRRRAAGVKP